MANRNGLRNDLGRVRGLGSAKEGVGHWWRQRLTAIALIPLSLWFVASLVFLSDTDHATAVHWLGSPVTLGLMVLFLAATFYHAALGLQVVIEDYQHDFSRIIAIVLLNFYSFAGAALAIFAILKIALTGAQA